MAATDTLTTAEVKRRLVSQVRERVPDTWQVRENAEPQANLQLEISTPDGKRARLVVETKQIVERRDVAGISDRLRRLAKDLSGTPVIAARYLSPSVREALTAIGVSYADATGNMRIVIDSPAMFISERGEDRDPWRKGRPRGTLKGEPAARVVRTLLDYRRDWRVRELIITAGTSSGATYRVLDYLQREDLLVKDEDRYRVMDWERLLRAWSADAAFQTTATVRTFIEPRGLDYFLATLGKGADFNVAVTGSVAANEWAAYAPAKAAFVYVSSVGAASEQWGLRSNATAPNVVLLEPKTAAGVPFVRTSESSAGYPVAAPAQVAADLLNGPGREPAEGDYLIEWLKANEKRWRLE